MFLAVLACSTPSEKTVNKFSDPVLVKIADLQDRRMGDSLYPYFHHQNPLYRREAVLAFGSIQVTGDVERIGKLLMMDADDGVRRAAAFALGQIHHSSGERLLLGALMRERDPENVRTILEAFGKVTNLWKLDPATFLSDSIKSAGLAWSIYRAGLRGKVAPVGDSIAATLIREPFSAETRLGAAHYFARGAKDTRAAESALIGAITDDPLPAVRMAAAIGLGKTKSDSALKVLTGVIAREKDPRVLINAVRALSYYPFEKTERVLFDCLGHKQSQVRIAASEVIGQVVTPNSWIRVSALVNLVQGWREKSDLYFAALKAGQHKDLAAEIQQQYREERDLLAKAALLRSLRCYPPAASFVLDELIKTDTAVIRTVAVAALVEMNYSTSFNKSLKQNFSQIYKQVLEKSQDPAVVGTVASALGDSTLGYRGTFRDVELLVSARRKLSLPQHMEAVQPLEVAIAYLRGTKAPEVVNPFNNPIDWGLVRGIPTDCKAVVRTNRGKMTIQLFVEEAPGSVANFVSLAASNYFDGKPIHRVVPNFVIQTGCSRGDGWGGKDYSIRSEFSERRYTTGSVGMASAGKDTEGTQWFVTHSPTPHLDGRYTIFGEVTDGLRVVDFLEMGDCILDVEIENFTTQ